MPRSPSPTDFDLPQPKSDDNDLFFPKSDSDSDYEEPTTTRKSSGSKPSNGSSGRASTSTRVEKPRAASSDSDIVAFSPVKRVIPSAPASSSGPSRKRPSISPSPSYNVPQGFTGGYLGEFVCEGWSLSKGKGYCSPGSTISFERPKPKAVVAAEAEAKLLERSKEKLGPARLVNGKMVHAKGKPVATKQATLGSMMKKSSPAPPPAKKNEKKPVVDQIIRFRNDRGFEVGRLSVSEAGFLVHLLDTGIISLAGHVIDCPPVLSTGATILLSVKVYLTKEAFVRVEREGRKDEGSFWQEQKETGEEEAMRHRKDALGSLFSRIGVKPLRSNALLLAQKKNGKAEINEKSLQHFSDKPKLARRSQSPSKKSDSSGSKDKGKKSARNSDDEDEAEGSGDEAEKLDEEQMDEIDTIYRKAQQGDNLLEETTPPSTFLYTLRPYQKQALTWMSAREAGDSSAVRESSLHPLWEEYAFKKEYQPGDPIEIDDDDDEIDPSRKFYWNPYSGEMSLTFPTSKTKARGGILADAMGMGKTCMMSSLIHLNRSGDVAIPDETQPPPDSAEPPTKRAKFLQVTLSNQWRAVPTAPKPASPAARATLVVCPVSLASQWHEELGKMSEKGSVNSFMWYGNDRVDVDRLLAQEGNKRVDVIITSYGTLGSEFQKWKKNKEKPNYEGGSIFDHEFLRIVLDEAHNIKNRTAMVSKACYELKGQRRWALSGTPIVNRLDDLYSLLHFLRLEPWGHYSFFRSFVTIPFLAQDPKALNVVQYILESCLLRREKTMRDRDGKLIVDLPPKTVELQVLPFSRPERLIYKHLEDRAKRRFIQMDAEGRAMSNYTSILAMLMKLRQCVDHPLLVLSKATEEDGAEDKLLEDGTGEQSLREMIAQYAGAAPSDGEGNTSGEAESTYAKMVLEDIENSGTSECMICTSEIFDEVLLPCYHRGCQDCIVNWIGSCEDQNKPALCPMCEKGPIAMSDLRSVQRQRKKINPITGRSTRASNGRNGDAEEKEDGEGQVTIGKVDLVSSTKLRALVRRLEVLRLEDPEMKALVFSQFTSFLDLIETTLDKAGIRYLRFDGSMSQAQRATTVEQFGKPSKEPLILLISLKAGGVGLNLTMANYVFMMDTWWNEAIEQQAIDRVHRLGQNKPVYVTRYVIKGTVEKRILKIPFVEPDSALFTEDLDRARLSDLRTRYKHLQSHMTAYPPSLSLIRDLKLEVRDDDGDAGWSLLRDLSGQIESLELQIRDRYVDLPAAGAFVADDGQHEAGMARWRSRWDEIPDVLEDWDKLLGPSTHFTSLVHLTFASTARGLRNFAELSKFAPHLTSLVWVCHWDSESHYNIDNDVGGPSGEASTQLASLVSLSISAAPVVIRWAMKRLLAYAPRLARLILYRKEVLGQFSPYSAEINNIVHLIADRPSITHLALYGSLPELFLGFAGNSATVPFSVTPPGRLNHIVSLVLERSTVWRGKAEREFPIPSSGGAIILFPSLQYITWVDSHDDQATGSAQGHDTKYYHEEVLRDFFLRREDLCQAQWVAGYPADPFVIVTADNSQQLDVRCCVPRPDGPDGPIRRIDVSCDAREPAGS